MRNTSCLASPSALPDAIAAHSLQQAMRCTLQVACLACTAAAYAPQRRRRASHRSAPNQKAMPGSSSASNQQPRKRRDSWAPNSKARRRRKLSSIPSIVEDESDALIHARTGSGKTLAYLLPLVERIDSSRQATQACVVVPTRELGLQVAKVLRRLTKGTVMSLLDGSSLKAATDLGLGGTPHVMCCRESHASPTHGRRGRPQEFRCVCVRGR